jgi:hypothetical protein
MMSDPLLTRVKGERLPWEGPEVTVPSIRPLLVPPAGFPARPTVVEPRGPD